MAFYIQMVKLADDGRHVDYSFGTGTDVGVVRWARRTNTISIVSPCPLDDAAGRWALRAQWKLARLASAGTFPQLTEWAS